LKVGAEEFNFAWFCPSLVIDPIGGHREGDEDITGGDRNIQGQGQATRAGCCTKTMKETGKGGGGKGKNTR